MSAMIAIQLQSGGEGLKERLSIAGPEMAPDAITQRLSGALQQGIQEMETHLKLNYLSGDALQTRSGALRQSIASAMRSLLSGVVGSMRGPATAYAKIHLGDGTTTIVPKNGKYLWQPIADNLTPKGVPRISPREAFAFVGSNGKPLLRIFKAKDGNTYAFLPESKPSDDGKSSVATDRVIKRGRNKGNEAGKLLFMLRKKSVIKGTDALAQAVNDKRERQSDLLQSALFGEGGAS